MLTEMTKSQESRRRFELHIVISGEQKCRKGEMPDMNSDWCLGLYHGVGSKRSSGLGGYG